MDMQVWSNIFLSMASLVMCMQLRSIYQEIDKRIRRHKNYRRILDYMNSQWVIYRSPFNTYIVCVVLYCELE